MYGQCPAARLEGTCLLAGAAGHMQVNLSPQSKHMLTRQNADTRVCNTPTANRPLYPHSNPRPLTQCLGGKVRGCFRWLLEEVLNKIYLLVIADQNQVCQIQFQQQRSGRLRCASTLIDDSCVDSQWSGALLFPFSKEPACGCNSA